MSQEVTPAAGQPAPQPVMRNAKATPGMVLGIISVFINTALVPSILAVIFSGIALGRSGEIERATGHPEGRGAAIVGLVTGIVGLLNSFLWKWLFLFVF